MEEALRVLDEYGKKVNLYELILKYAERGHQILNGAAPLVEDDITSVVRIVLREAADSKISGTK